MVQVWLGNTIGFGTGVFDNMRPVRFAFRAAGLEQSALRRIQESLKVTGHLPASPTIELSNLKVVWKEGGVLACLEGLPSKPSLSVLENGMKTQLSSCGREVSPRIVRGTGFTEDMQAGFPTKRLQVRLESLPAGASLTPSQQLFPLNGHTPGVAIEEMLYDIFRDYGKIKSIEIAPLPEPAPAFGLGHDQRHGAGVRIDSAGGSTYFVTFTKRIRAIDAKMALNGAAIEGTPLSPPRVLQVKYQRMAWPPIIERAWGSAVGSKIFFPLLLVGGSFVLFSLIKPLRVFNVTQTLAMNWRDQDVKAPEEKEFPWIEREEEMILGEKLSSQPSSSILVQGVAGSGKTSILKKLLANRKFAARIDCSKLPPSSPSAVEEHSMVDDMATAVGFSPSFPSLNMILTYLEGTMMVKKPSIITNREVQLSTISETVKQALGIISLLYPRDSAKPFPYAVIVFDGFESFIKAMKSSPEDVNGFALDTIFKFAHTVSVINHTAHVVFACNNSECEEIVKSFPLWKGRLDTVQVNGLESALISKVLLEHFEAREVEAFMKGELRGQGSFKAFGVQILGDRVGDLHSLISLRKNTSSLSECVAQLIRSAKSDLLRLGFPKNQREWTHVEFWKAIQMLNHTPRVKYLDLLFNVFHGNEEGLRALIQNDLLTVTEERQENREPTRYVKAGSPLIAAAFVALEGDEIFRSKLERTVITERISLLQEQIATIEAELVKLEEAKAGSFPAGIQRKATLVKKLGELNAEFDLNEAALCLK